MIKRSHAAVICAIVIFLSAFSFAQDGNPTTVFLVRHAEKESDTENPDLSVDGKIRSQQLIHVLGSSGISAIFTSQYMRTKKTAEPLAEFLKVKSVEVDARRRTNL